MMETVMVEMADIPFLPRDCLSFEDRRAPRLSRCSRGCLGADIDFAQLVKLYGDSPEAEKRYSPAECIGARKTPISGNPDPKHISISYAERQNLTMRMHMRRFTRLTNAFSKKFESHVHMVALYTVWYNWLRIHKALRVTPAMADGLTDKLMGFEDIVALMDAVAPKPDRPKVYRKKPLQISN
jgi:hypothetical protein